MNQIRHSTWVTPEDFIDDIRFDCHCFVDFNGVLKYSRYSFMKRRFYKVSERQKIFYKIDELRKVMFIKEPEL